ncbi:MAG: pilus assembly protein [Nitrospira sp.]|nr:pilus assembly protein [Nitrospira sp.]
MMKRKRIQHRRISLSKKIFRPCQNEAGISAVETGATMLLFIIALFSVIEFGWYFVHQTTLTAAVRDGIRLGAIGDSLSDESGNQMSREESIRQAIKERADPVMDIDPSNILIFPVQANWTDPDDPAVNNAGGAGAFMRVRVQYNHTFFTSLIGGFFGGQTIQMQSEGTYRNENFIL